MFLPKEHLLLINTLIIQTFVILGLKLHKQHYSIPLISSNIINILNLQHTF